MAALAINVGVMVTEVEATTTDEVALFETVLLLDDVVEVLEALDVFEEELTVEDVGEFSRTQIWPTIFKVATKY